MTDWKQNNKGNFGQNAGKAGVVYILREMDNHHKLGKRKTHLFKIGESTRSGKTRAIELTTEAQESGSNVSYEFITESRTQDCYGSEQLVFKKLEGFRLGSFGEWGGHELFEFIDDDQLQNAIKVIRETCANIEVNEAREKEEFRQRETEKEEAEKQRQARKNEELRREREERKTHEAREKAKNKTGWFHSIRIAAAWVFWSFIIGFFGLILFLIFFGNEKHETTVPNSSYQPPSAPTTYIQTAPAYKPPATYVQPVPVSSVVKDTKKSISPNDLNLLSDAKAMVIRMIDYALSDGGLKNESELQQTQKRITTLPKPAKTNIKAARDANNNGLVLAKAEKYDEAVKFFEKGNALNPADIEIVGNLGFAYVKLNQLDSAQQAMMTSLAMAPNRATAWANLGDIYALKNDKYRAVACLANAYRFSRNREKTHQFFKSLNEKESVEQLKQARNEAITWAEKTYFLKQSIIENDTPEITDKKIPEQNQKKQNVGYLTREQAIQVDAAEKRVNEEEKLEHFNTCLTGRYAKSSFCKREDLTREQAIQVDAAENRVNEEEKLEHFNTCLTGRYAKSSFCKREDLTREQAIQVDAAEKRTKFY